MLTNRSAYTTEIHQLLFCAVEHLSHILVLMDECCVCNLKVQEAPGLSSPARRAGAGDKGGERRDGSRGPKESGERKRAGEAERRQREVKNTLTSHPLQNNIHEISLTFTALLSLCVRTLFEYGEKSKDWFEYMSKIFLIQAVWADGSSVEI